MNESSLLKSALVTAFIGLFALILVLKFSGVEQSNISTARLSSEDSHVKVSGFVSKVSSSGNLTIITLKREESLEIVVFEKVNLSKGSEILAEGKIKDYNGRKEVLAEKIILK